MFSNIKLLRRLDRHQANVTDWSTTWFTFAGYALVLGIIFPVVFKYKHDRDGCKQTLNTY